MTKEQNMSPDIGDNLADERTLIPMGNLGEQSDNQEEMQDSEYCMVLKHPLKIVGEEIRYLEYDFDALTANDLHQASKYLKNLGIPVSVPALDYEYQLVVFHKAVKKKMPDVMLADLMRLSGADAMKATGLARDFLLDKDPGLKDLGSEESSLS
ncbi:hypothetical protein [Clostridium sp. KNHs216]|uniref:hypothetical protein n=1 Tax=Clostridium sp. KNHs216 TaxID=1550235 RepID=UPI001154F28E|nr:hypothetical protein [Clostridium sp. KNHs216]TQI66732.1 hypothetical protein LY85_1403 [Clostridium sp. KNHs216]